MNTREKAQDPKKTLLKKRNKDAVEKEKEKKTLLKGNKFFIIQEVIYLCLKAHKQSLTRREETFV